MKIRTLIFAILFAVVFTFLQTNTLTYTAFASIESNKYNDGKLLADSLFLEDQFNYVSGTELTANGWVAHSLAITKPIKVYEGGLSYAGYPPVSGNAAFLDSIGQCVHRVVNTQTTGTLYYSFLVKVISPANGYFIHLAYDATLSGSAAMVHIRYSNGNLQFGISNTSVGVFSSNPTNFSLNTTYLCIVKYNVSNTGACSLWVKSSGVPGSESEAGAPEVVTSGDGERTIRWLSLRQFHASHEILVDEIRVSNSWAQAPMPVELSSFSSNVSGRNVRLNWITESEQNNVGFEIQRKSSEPGTVSSEQWKNVGYIKGNGTTNIPASYSFEDRNLSTGKYMYRLKQSDVNGNFEYHALNGEVEIGIPKKFYLSRNYPNPFNPVTKINFDLPERGRVELRLYDMLGREVAVILNEILSAGYHTAVFDASGLSSGIYFYKMVSGKYAGVKKLAVIK